MNTTETLIWLIPAMLAWAILSTLYWTIVRPVLHSAILFRIYKRRDQLRMLAINGHLSTNSFSYAFIEKWLSRTAYESPEITLCNFFRFCFSTHAKTDYPALEQFSAEATPETNTILTESVKDVILMMLVNSPIIAIVGIAVLFIRAFITT